MVPDCGECQEDLRWGFCATHGRQWREAVRWERHRRHLFMRKSTAKAWSETPEFVNLQRWFIQHWPVCRNCICQGVLSTSTHAMPSFWPMQWLQFLQPENLMPLCDYCADEARERLGMDSDAE